MQKKLEILFLSNRSPLPIKDGHTRRTYNILKGLAEKHNVHFVTLYEAEDELDEKNVKHLKEFCKNVKFFPAPPKTLSLSMLLRLIRSLFSIDPYTIWRHYSSEYYNEVNTLISSGKYDIVHCDNLPVSYTCRHIKSVFRSITDHDVSYLKCARMAKETNNILLKMFLYHESIKIRNLEKQVLKQFNLGIVVSSVDMAKLQTIAPESTLLVIENGVNTEEFKPSEKVAVENDKLIWVGGFKHFSNECGMYFFLKKVYPELKKKRPNIRLDIIGDELSVRLNKIVLSDSSIRCLGFVDDTLPYIQSASVFIVPITSGSGTRLKLLEALAVGKATISTSIGCEGIEGLDGVHYVVANTPTEFSDSVINLLDSHDERAKLEKNARKLSVEKYDWSVIVSKLNAHYMQIEN